MDVRKVKVVKELGKYEFQCKQCKTVHKMDMYPVAQLSMGHDITHTCDCGNKTDLKSKIYKKLWKHN